MATKTFAPLLGKRMRITELDSCGRPNAAGTPDSFLVTDGFVSVGLSAEVEDGNEITVRRADGSLCVNEKLASEFKRFNVEAEFCGVNPSIAAMVSNSEVYLDYAGDTAGFTVAEGTIKKWFALELWTGLSGIGCEEGADEASGYLLLPFLVAGTIGDLTVDGENAVNFSLSGVATKGGNAWGAGPYNVVYNGSGAPAVLPTPVDTLDHLLMVETGLAVPPASADPQPMPAAGGVTTTTTTRAATTTTTTV